MKRLSQHLLFECDLTHCNAYVIAKINKPSNKRQQKPPVQRQNGLGATLFKKDHVINGKITRQIL